MTALRARFEKGGLPASLVCHTVLAVKAVRCSLRCATPRSRLPTVAEPVTAPLRCVGSDFGQSARDTE